MVYGWDGKGYPQGLSHDEIPLGARIFPVVDTFDSMTSDRPYRQAKSTMDAMNEILRCSGTQFDPNVVAAFMQAYERGLLTRQENPIPIYDSYVESVVESGFRHVDQTLVE